ncbi:MAG: hypothetical protein ABSE39_03050 [Candidatus Bathyarchaeia archaeon]|jgi:hypothetical protein
MERVMAPAAIGLVLLGLLFVVGGFGAFVAGHLEGWLIVFIGVAMLWAGWAGSQARGLSCLIAVCLNTFDASITIASWNYEINPLVLSAGPTLFVAAKLLSSLAIVLFARTVPNPRKGGYLLSTAFALIMAWNLTQLALLSFHTESLTQALFWGSAASLAVAFATLMVVAYRRSRTADS